MLHAICSQSGFDRMPLTVPGLNTLTHSWQRFPGNLLISGLDARSYSERLYSERRETGAPREESLLRKKVCMCMRVCGCRGACQERMPPWASSPTTATHMGLARLRAWRPLQQALPVHVSMVRPSMHVRHECACKPDAYMLLLLRAPCITLYLECVCVWVCTCFVCARSHASACGDD